MPMRLTSLDGLRGLAACGVAFGYHPLLELSGAVAPQAWGPAVWLRHWGWSFVDLFFVISGYIFAHVYLRDGARPTRDTLGDFAVARIARLYPLHFVMLLVCAFLYGAAPENTAEAFVAHLVMMQAFVEPTVRHFNGPTWSISVEVACYALFALGAVRSDRVLRRITAAAILIPLLYLVLFGRTGGPWYADCIPRGPLGFFIGQVLWRNHAVLAQVPTAVLAAICLTGFMLVGHGPLSPLLPIDLLLWPAAVLLAPRLVVLASRPMLWLGDRSYAVYLIHYPVMLYALPSLHAAPTGWLSAAIILGYAAVVLFYADFAYRRLEVPARRAIRAAWERRRAKTGAFAAAA